jgi:hypothetical protein
MKKKKFNLDRIRYLLLWSILAAIFVHGFLKYGLLNQVIGMIIRRADAQVSTTNGVPNWSQISFSTMDVASSGSATFPTSQGNQTVTWTVGENIGNFMTLGDFQTTQLQLDSLTLNQILTPQGLTIGQVPLTSFPLAGQQTVPNLVQAIPSLAPLPVNSVAPINRLIQKLGLPNDGTIGDLANLSQLQNTPLSKVNLSKYTLSSVPGIDQATLNKFNNWQSSLINQVPGLSTLTWNNLAGLGSLDLSFVGQVDIPYGTEEQNRTYTISGSDQQGYNVPCNQASCAHVEISVLGQNGLQWISGDSQQVHGGFGILAAANGGQEPTGREPFGSAFKQVIGTVDEANGTIYTNMYFRFCTTIPFVGLTCTPYFVGPVPFINYNEKDPIILGVPNSLPTTPSP